MEKCRELSRYEGHITEKDMESGEISSQRQDAEDAKTDDSISG